MKTILVPTDFSENAVNALEYAVEIARITHSKVVLLHTFQIPVMDTSVPTFMVQSMVEEEEKRCEEALSRITREITQKSYWGSDQPVNCEYLVKQGFAVEEILFYGTEKKADIIVMGTQGASGLKRMILGSNTAHVIERSEVPVIAVPAAAKYHPVKQVVYATQLQEGDEKVVRKLVDFSRRFEAEITVLHIGKHEDAELEERLLKFKERVAGLTSYDKIDYNIFSHSSVPEGINKYLDENDVNLLAMVTHHRNLFQQMFSPSLTKKMAFHAHVPLMAFRQ